MDGRNLNEAQDILIAVQSAGGNATVHGGNLRLTAPKPLPDELVAKLRKYKAALLQVLGNDEYHGIHVADLQRYAGDDWPHLRDHPEQLEAFAEAVSCRLLREKGKVPSHYTQACVCASCGPVWLWAGAPRHVAGCPWCFNRISGRPIPRPDHEPLASGQGG